jgi:flagellar biosynthesis protein FliQ
VENSWSDLLLKIGFSLTLFGVIVGLILAFIGAISQIWK